MNRAWIIILSLGIGALCLLGLGMKYVIDANPELQAVIKFKTALAEDFGPRGIDSVSVYALRGKSGHEIRVTLPAPGPEPAASSLEAELMEYYVTRFPGKMGSFLAINQIPAGGPGCSVPESTRRTEVPIASVRQKLEDRRRVAGLGPRLESAGAGSVLSQAREGATLLLDLETTSAERRQAREVAAAAEPLIREAFGATHYATLRLRVFPHPQAKLPPAPAAAGLPAGAVEVRYDRRGREAAGSRTGKKLSP
jgi:hypothetical protein